MYKYRNLSVPHHWNEARRNSVGYSGIHTHQLTRGIIKHIHQPANPSKNPRTPNPLIPPLQQFIQLSLQRPIVLPQLRDTIPKHLLIIISEHTRLIPHIHIFRSNRALRVAIMNDHCFPPSSPQISSVLRNRCNRLMHPPPLSRRQCQVPQRAIRSQQIKRQMRAMLNFVVPTIQIPDQQFLSALRSVEALAQNLSRARADVEVG